MEFADYATRLVKFETDNNNEYYWKKERKEYQIKAAMSFIEQTPNKPQIIKIG